MTTPLKKALFPRAEVSRWDTGLRFTDILFGFVIRELFLRLQNWGELAGYVRCQLIAGTVLVLGSWIGFRRSVNRSQYELKFFNLPLARFVLDQLMVVLYFRIATRTPDKVGTPAPSADDVVGATTEIVVLIFFLYAVWDLLGIWMASAKDRGGDPTKHKYPVIDEATKKPKEPLTPNRQDRAAFWITLAFLVVFGGLWTVADQADVGEGAAQVMFIAIGVLLLTYRFAKEVKTSLRS